MSRVLKKTIYPHTHFGYKPKGLKFKKSKMSVGVYLDNSASTPIDPEVLKEMVETSKLYGNPSSFNNAGREARNKLEECRLTIARFIGVRTEEAIFTSSGSEANNLAIFGLASLSSKKGEIISTPIEHPSVLGPLKKLENLGWKITYLKVNHGGLVDLEDLKQKLNPRVVLVSIIYANNEIGTIQPIVKISKIINDFKKNLPPTTYNLQPIFHIDACQAAGYLDMNVNNLGVDLMTFNGAKIYGPKGVGVLCKKRVVKLNPLIHGGDQEYGLRAGTENLPAVAGLAKAVFLIDKNEGLKVMKLRDYFLDKVTQILPVKINGPRGGARLANNINISVPGLDSENILLELDKYGVYASAGSACTAHLVEPSHVLKAIGVKNEYLSGVLRFSLGRQTTKKNIDYVLEVLPKIMANLKQRYKK